MHLTRILTLWPWPKIITNSRFSATHFCFQCIGCLFIYYITIYIAQSRIMIILLDWVSPNITYIRFWSQHDRQHWSHLKVDGIQCFNIISMIRYYISNDCCSVTTCSTISIILNSYEESVIQTRKLQSTEINHGVTIGTCQWPSIINVYINKLSLVSTKTSTKPPHQLFILYMHLNHPV